MSVQFTALWEYDPKEDGDVVLGYPFEGEIKREFIGYYKLSSQGWTRLRGKRWRRVKTPLSFAKIPEIERVKMRKPSIKKIEALTLQQALNYMTSESQGKNFLIRLVQQELLRVFYPEKKEVNL